MNEFILKESISPAGLESPAEFKHYIITDGKTIILAKDDQEDDGQAIMLLAVMNAYGGTIWVDNSDKLIIGHQKEEIKWLSEQLAAKDKEIERLKAICLKQFNDMMDDARKQGATDEIIAARRPQYIKENNL